jgi:hypothetical protein
MKNYNFAFNFAWVCNWVSDIKERTWIKGTENKLLRRIFGPKGDEVIGCWRKLHKAELHNFYSSSNKI